MDKRTLKWTIAPGAAERGARAPWKHHASDIGWGARIIGLRLPGMRPEETDLREAEVPPGGVCFLVTGIIGVPPPGWFFYVTQRGGSSIKVGADPGPTVFDPTYFPDISPGPCQHHGWVLAVRNVSARAVKYHAWDPAQPSEERQAPLQLLLLPTWVGEEEVVEDAAQLRPTDPDARGAKRFGASDGERDVVDGKSRR